MGESVECSNQLGSHLSCVFLSYHLGQANHYRPLRQEVKVISLAEDEHPCKYQCSRTSLIKNYMVMKLFIENSYNLDTLPHFLLVNY